MGEFSRLGCGIWNWGPYVDLDYATRNLWLALYTSSEAKRLVPGLWHGGIGTMADASRMNTDEVLTSLDRLLDRGLAEYDQRNRVLRLTSLPDAGERAHNAKSIKGWWNRFVTVPVCGVRDAHIDLLWWMLKQGSRPQEMLDAWAATFGKVVPVVNPHRRQRLVDSDTGTTTQPSLFGSPVDKPKSSVSGGTSDWVSDTQSIAPGSGSGSGSGIPEEEGGRQAVAPESGSGAERSDDHDRGQPAWARRPVRLQLVPAEAMPAPRDRMAEERNAYAAQMRAAQRAVLEEMPETAAGELKWVLS